MLRREFLEDSSKENTPAGPENSLYSALNGYDGYLQVSELHVIMSLLVFIVLEDFKLLRRETIHVSRDNILQSFQIRGSIPREYIFK